MAYSSMQAGKDETIRLALYTDDEPAIRDPLEIKTLEMPRITANLVIFGAL